MWHALPGFLRKLDDVTRTELGRRLPLDVAPIKVRARAHDRQAGTGRQTDTDKLTDRQTDVATAWRGDNLRETTEHTAATPLARAAGWLTSCGSSTTFAGLRRCGCHNAPGLETGMMMMVMLSHTVYHGNGATGV